MKNYILHAHGFWFTPQRLYWPHGAKWIMLGHFGGRGGNGAALIIGLLFIVAVVLLLRAPASKGKDDK